MFSFSWFLIFVALLVYLVVVANFRDITQPRFTVILSDTTESFVDFYSTKTLRDLHVAHEYALLSYAVYQKESSFKKLSKKLLETSSRKDDKIWKLCKELSPKYDYMDGLWEEYPIQNIQSRPSDAKDWYRDCSKNLVHKVYRRRKLNVKDERVFALIFRGTYGINDWCSNLHWFTKFVPFTFDHYDVVRSISGQIVDSIDTYAKKSGEKVKIIAAGHSLGGGLAHHAAFSADRISTVYAFDSSSVTGFYDIQKSARNKRVKDMRIYRIHERGEILAYLRRFMKTIWPVASRNPQIVEIRYHFQENRIKLISLHNMGALANDLTNEYMEHSSTTQ